MSYTVISADCHLDLTFLPKDMFVSQAPRESRELVPHVRETSEGVFWFAEEGNQLDRYGFEPTGTNFLGGGKREQTLTAAGFKTGLPRTSDVPLRLEDQDQDGVDGEVIYGITSIDRRVQSKPVLTLIYEIYNEWVADWQKSAPQRLFPLGAIPNHDAELAALSARACADLGLWGVSFNVATAPAPIWDSSWAPLWHTLEELEFPVALHAFTISNNVMGGSPGTHQDVVAAAGASIITPARADESAAGLILGGVLEQYPKLVVGLGESGIGWLPYLLERMDYTYEDRVNTSLDLRRLPSEYFKSNMFATYIKDQVGTRVMWELGYLDNIMWSTDYPHADSTWPNSQDAIAWTFAGLPDTVKRACMHDNVCRAYRI